MSIGSSLSGINFSGLSSGIDTNSIISRLIALEAIPTQRLQQQKAALQNKQSLFSTFKGQLTNLSTKAGALNSASAFSLVSAASSKTEVATVAVAEGAVPGTYNLNVTKLAQFHKVSSSAFADTTSAVNLSGEMVVNGKTVTISASDSLTTIAQKINGLNSGATASIINGGSGNAYLTLTAGKSGLSNKLQVADVSGGNLAQSLGIVSGSVSIANSITNGFATRSFESTTTTLGTMLGNTDRGTGSFVLNGQTINVDFATDNLQSLVSKINAAGAGATATVETVKINGQDRYRLNITGDSGVPTYTDTNGILEEMGALQRSFGTELVTAQNAEYKLDNVNFTSESNTVTGVVPGVTLTLLKENDSSTITLTQDSGATKQKIRDFMDAYNAVVDFVKQTSQFDKDTFESGPLFGDSTVRTVESSIGDLMFRTVSGLATQYSNLTQLGFTFDESSQLKLDESILDTALNTNSTAVGNLFRTTGTTTADGLSFVSATPKAKASGPAGYSVVVTQAATKHAKKYSFDGGAAPMNGSFTFNGALFGSTNYIVNVAAGTTVDQLVTQLNTDSKLKDLIVATNDGGELKIESKKFGTAGVFTVAPAPIGEDPAFVTNTSTVDGLDIAGTINGEAATGNGQFLTGNTGNANTEGLQIQYSGSASGNIGSLNVSIGVGSSVLNWIATLTDSVNGMLTSNDQAITAQIETIDQSISQLEERIKLKETSLRRRFAAMEEAIARMQQQGNQLSSLSAR